MKMKRILNCAITGSIHSPTMSDYLPYKISDIAQQAIDAANAGATAIHLHVRNQENGAPASDIELYDELISTIRSKNKSVILCITTGGGIGMSIEERMKSIPKFKPELASMNAGSFNWGLFTLADKYDEWKFGWEKDYYAQTRHFIFQNTFEDMEGALRIMEETGTKPELECYDTGHLYNMKYLQDAGILKGKPYFQFVLGINGAMGANPYALMDMKNTADRLFGVNGYEWSAFGAGRMEFPICTQNLFLGGHVRVGLEDNLYLRKGVKAKSNAELVEKMVRIMGEFDYEPATPDEGREILGIQ